MEQLLTTPEKLVANVFWIVVIMVALTTVVIFDELIIKPAFERDSGRPEEAFLNWGNNRQL